MNNDEKLKRIEELEIKLYELKNEIKNDAKNETRFKIGDWVCVNHGEYPEYFSREVGQITHFDYTYSSEGTAQFKYVVGGGWQDSYLRYAHPKEIEYAKTGLPFIYNKKTKKYELVEINGENFKIGDLIDTSNLTGKTLISVLLDMDIFDKKGKEDLIKIFENLE